jgi:RND family efflux transporter MFP subunit
MQLNHAKPAKKVSPGIAAALLCSAGLIFAAVSGCNKPAGGPATAGMQPPKPPEVLFDVPSVTEVTDYEDFTGRTMAKETIDIRARVTGYLDKVNFTEGAEVKEGDLLFEIDPRTYQAEVDRARSNVQQAEAHNKRLISDLQRAKVLIPNHTITPEEYDRILGDQAEAEAAVGVAKASLELALQNLDYTKIRSRISGRMGRSLLDAGNLVKADDTILTTIVAMDPIYAYFGVDEHLLKKIHDYIETGLVKKNKDGQIPILMGVANEEGFPHPGAVNFIDNRLDTNTGTLQVRGMFPNTNHVILPGLYCRVRLPLGNSYKAITVPDVALATDQGQKFIYVVNPQNKIEYRHIQAGKLQDGQRIIYKGIAEGERIVVSGIQRVHDGVVVDPKPARASAGTEQKTKAGELMQTSFTQPGPSSGENDGKAGATQIQTNPPMQSNQQVQSGDSAPSNLQAQPNIQVQPTTQVQPSTPPILLRDGGVAPNAKKASSEIQ